MAAAYAALVSLLNTMDLINNHPRLSTSFDNSQNQSLREKVVFFLDFMENYSDAKLDLVRRIAVAAHEAEDIIEVEAADRIQAASTQQCPSYLLNLHKIIQDMDFIRENAIKAKEESGIFINQQATYSMPSPSTSKIVGFEGYVEQLLDELTGQHYSRKIIPIVGMGGIGKTTLVRNVYGNLLIVHHFDVRAWVTVSQEFNENKILLQALSCLGLGGSTSKTGRTDDQLGQELYKILCGRRYLVVLDDVWSVEAWEKINFFFPENNNGSRIVITTRESELDDYFGSCALAVDFLDDKNSWELFCDKTFAQNECCPPELVEIGKKIVKKCEGLPLAIVVIGGLLGKSPRTQEYWEKIVKEKCLIDLDSSEGNKTILSILYLSYKQLPVWLKSCFLQLGVFPEDHDIRVPQLIKLWVAEGLIKPKTTDQISLEEIAESYIKDLVDRNLLLVRGLRPNKKFGICCIHDLVRELCIRIAEEENFFRVERESRLMRVLLRDTDPLDSTFRQVNLRFLVNEFDKMETYSLPSSISLLWSLQTLIVRGISTVVAPIEIWKMPQLRHIQMWLIHLHPPPPSDVVLGNLQTLERAQNLNFTEEVCKRIPNIKELYIHYDFDDDEPTSSCYHLQNVDRLSKLESLQYSCYMYEHAGDSLQDLKLPSSIKELTLEGSNLVWRHMAMIASLPRLEILKLLGKAVVGAEWNFGDEEFVCLKHLRLGGCDDLIEWIAESSNFPALETLSLDCLSKLEEIPSGIGEIPTLERVYMHGCSESATISAVGIMEEQESVGNESLQLQLKFRDHTEAEMWRGKIRQLGFSCQNLFISSIFR